MHKYQIAFFYSNGDITETGYSHYDSAAQHARARFEDTESGCVGFIVYNSLNMSQRLKRYPDNDDKILQAMNDYKLGSKG